MFFSLLQPEGKRQGICGKRSLKKNTQKQEKKARLCFFISHKGFFGVTELRAEEKERFLEWGRRGYSCF